MSVLVSDTWALTHRWLIHARRDMMSLVMGLLQPLIFLGLFGKVLAGVMGGALRGGGGQDVVTDSDFYLQFYVSGVLAFTILTNAVLGGIPLVFDRETGFIDKILSAPVSRTAIVLSRFIYVTGYSLLQAFLVLAFAFLFGLRMELSQLPMAVGSVIVFGTLLAAGITALSLAVAFVIPHHSVFFAIAGFMTPFFALSSAFVPPDKIPIAWMRFVAEWNPLTHAIDPIRAAIAGRTPTALAINLGVLVAFDIACFVLAVRVIRRRLD